MVLPLWLFNMYILEVLISVFMVLSGGNNLGNNLGNLGKFSCMYRQSYVHTSGQKIFSLKNLLVE